MSDRGARAARGQLSITIRWGEETLTHRLVSPGERFVVGTEGDVDFAVPDELGGAKSLELARLNRAGEATVNVEGATRSLERGERVAIDVGPVVVEIAHALSAPMAKGRARAPWRHLASQALSALAVGSLLVTSAYWVPSAETLAAEEDEQRYLMQRYLNAAEERRVEAAELDHGEVAAVGDERREGGAGTRAKGEEGSMGAPSGATAHRYGVAGPVDPGIARAAALRDAAEFGMIGLVGRGSGSGRGGGGVGVAGNHAWGSDPRGAFGRNDSVASGDSFASYGVNGRVSPVDDPVSTFAVDVDTGSLPIVRRHLNEGRLVSSAAVRPEEVINYFDYGYDGPNEGETFAAHVHAAPSPFEEGHHILRVGIQARRAPRTVPAHLIYLVDTSGSMQSPDKIGLVKKSLRLLTQNLRPGDTVALCTYAGSVREVLAPTGVQNRGRILRAIDGLDAAGSTAMGSGLALAYGLAGRTLVKGHINRVIVLSDGDANVGATTHADILATIERQRRRGITLSTIGFGMGNYNDVMMERLADEGDGNYRYVDDIHEARRVFVEQVDGMLEVVAKDVKIQVAFDPKVVQSYRLVGYENRDVADEDFRDDAVDGGEVGAGHDVTALYDVVLKPTRVASARGSAGASAGSAWATVRVRYQAPLGGDARERAFPLRHGNVHARFDDASAAFRFATAAAGFAEVLRESPHARRWSLGKVKRVIATSTEGHQEREQLREMVHRAQALGAS